MSLAIFWVVLVSFLFFAHEFLLPENTNHHGTFWCRQDFYYETPDEKVPSTGFFHISSNTQPKKQ
jgi:hypothetical protein